jgi:proteasome lid subunit RPN8/RPN11
MSKKKRVAILSLAAEAVIRGYFHVGEHCAANECEQIVALGGQFRGRKIKIMHVIPIVTAHATRQSVRVGAEDWWRAISALNRCGLTLVGSAHTHPNMGVFMSAADLEAHGKLFRDGVSIVVNPQSGDAAGFGADGGRITLSAAKTRSDAKAIKKQRLIAKDGGI